MEDLWRKFGKEGFDGIFVSEEGFPSNLLTPSMYLNSLYKF